MRTYRTWILQGFVFAGTILVSVYLWFATIDSRISRYMNQNQPVGWVQTLDNLNWSALEVVRPLLQKDMKEAVRDKKWQEFCTEIMDLAMPAKYARLSEWLQLHDFDETSRIQVTSYVHLLRRKGKIK